MSAIDRYPSVASLLRALRPADPVYCIYPGVYTQVARQFVELFPGRVLYAVKACSQPEVIDLLLQAGVRDFDCASLAEIETVHGRDPQAQCFFMVPVRLRGEANAAFHEFGVRHFLIDHLSGIDALAAELPFREIVVFARMAVHHPAATCDLSTRFGAPKGEIPGLLQAIAARGAEPALAFNVGSSVTDPAAYRHALSEATDVLNDCDLDIRLVDVGGGFPRSYPGFEMPPLNSFFTAIREAARTLPLPANGEILGEPGRALAGPGMSAVSEVLQRKDGRLYINDGMHGIFWELRYKGHKSFPVRCYRNGELLAGSTRPFTLIGPTCDSEDVLPGTVDLPADIRAGDYIESGRLGAYSLSGRTDFNGRYSTHIVMIDGPEELPPGHLEYRN